MDGQWSCQKKRRSLFYDLASKITNVVEIGIKKKFPISITHHGIFIHVTSFSISSHRLSHPIPCLPPPRGVWNGWTTRGVVFALCGRYFHSPTDTKELLYDPASVMNGDTLKFCLKEAWCKLSFFVLSFFYYLYWWVAHRRCVFGQAIIGLHVKRLH